MMGSVEFGSLFTFIRNGMNIKQQKERDGLPITRIETIWNGTIDGDRVGYAGLAEADCREWLLKSDDILLSHINSAEQVGKCAIYQGHPEKLVHGMNLLCLRPDKSKLHPRFLTYLLKTPGFRAKFERFVNRAVNQASVSIGNLKSIEIEVPSLQEQGRIAAILDQADDLRRKRRQAVELLNGLVQAIFVEMFGTTGPQQTTEWDVTQLRDLVREGDQINYGVVQPGSECENGVPLVRVANLVDEDFSLASLKKIAPEIERQYKRSRLKGDEILVACVGSIGAISLATPDLAGTNIARAVARVPIDEQKAKRNFIAEFLRLDQTQRYFAAETRAVAQPTLNIKQLSETPVICPPIRLQQEFSDRIRQIDQVKNSYRAHRAKLEELFASLQHRAFRRQFGVAKSASQPSELKKVS